MTLNVPRIIHRTQISLLKLASSTPFYAHYCFFFKRLTSQKTLMKSNKQVMIKAQHSIVELSLCKWMRSVKFNWCYFTYRKTIKKMRVDVIKTVRKTRPNLIVLSVLSLLSVIDYYFILTILSCWMLFYIRKESSNRIQH